jgi:Pyruvate/2-oxoacid:ferredoxin oxidoreductase delta subunit/flavodoxin
MIQKAIIYYFTGTGNSGNVAQWFLQVAQSKNIDCKLVDIAKTERRHLPSPTPDTLVVFVSPIHGFNYSPIMLHFIANFPKGKNKVVLMNTRAGMLIGKWITPGLTGFAFYLSMLMLRIKGYSLQGTLPVDLPSNWLSLHPGLNLPTVQYLHSRNKERVSAFAEKILAGHTVFKGQGEIIQDLVAIPISLGYYLFGRFLLSKTFYASSACNKCGLCIQNCPVKAIILIDNRPYWTYRCESCMKCMGYCPPKAVETAHGFIALVVFIFTYFVSQWFYAFTSQYLKWMPTGIPQSILKTLLFLGLLMLCYRLMHFALRFKLFERLMVYTSLTWYKFWGRRYRALKNE